MHCPKEGYSQPGHKLSRRNFLKLGIAAALVSASPSFSLGAIQDSLPSEKTLSFYNIHTGESLSAIYWSKGKYLPEALNEINHILRDYRTEEVKPIDTQLLDLLYDIRNNLDSLESFYIISGFRSYSTNTLLRRHSRGVSKSSLHMYGKAVDIRLPKFELFLLRDVAINQKRGGVGYYPWSNFIHIDVGRVRYW